MDAAALAPDKAATVPAKAEVDQVGRFEDSGSELVADGRFDKCVSEYSGVSVGESRNKWWDMSVLTMAVGIVTR